MRSSIVWSPGSLTCLSTGIVLMYAVTPGSAGSTLGGTPTTSRGGQEFWDPYLAFRVAQAWGGFTASLHTNYNGATYYSAPTPGFLWWFA